MYFSHQILLYPISLIAAAIIAAVGMSSSFVVAGESSVGDATLFERLDSNDDGLVSVQEVSARQERLFARLIRRADDNGDEALTREEFLDSLVPSRPKKPIEAKQPATPPEAAAVRYLLLAIDTDINSVIEPAEVPEDMQPVFAAMLERLDQNGNGSLEPLELIRGGPPLARLAARFVESREIDTAEELQKLERAQGNAADRFDGRRPPLEMLGDPRQARSLFARLDGNGDGLLEVEEVPEPFQPQLERFLRLGDRDQDGRLSEREFLVGAERISRFLGRPR